MLEKLYRGSEDGFNGTAYHSKCNRLSHILNVVKSEYGERFGAYSSVSFDSSLSAYNDRNAFLFSLTKQKKFELIDPESKSWAFHPGPCNRIILFG
jgi:hypothetical protein